MKKKTRSAHQMIRLTPESQKDMRVISKVRDRSVPYLIQLAVDRFIAQWKRSQARRGS